MIAIDASAKCWMTFCPVPLPPFARQLWRSIGQRAFDTQLIGGIVLHEGRIAEMKTGEGKTLTATFPLYLNALTSRGVHLITPNDYLSKYGVQWMGPVYHMLGLSVAVIQSMGRRPLHGLFSL